MLKLKLRRELDKNSAYFLLEGGYVGLNFDIIWILDMETF